MAKSSTAKKGTRTVWTQTKGLEMNFGEEKDMVQGDSDEDEPGYEIDYDAIREHILKYHGPTKKFVKKKGSLKPSRPLTDEERDALFGKRKDVTTKDELPNAQASTNLKENGQKKKKNSGKAPNAIRKTKKPSRL